MAVNASFSRTWNAAIDVFAARNIPIETLDRASGLIVARPQELYYSDSTMLADCGRRQFSGRQYASMAYYNVLIRGDSTHSTVHVTSKWVTKDGFLCNTKGVFEAGFEKNVKQKAEAPATAGQTTH